MAEETQSNGSSILTDGSTSFAGGVDSIKVTTLASDLNPNGLRRDQLSWLINGTVRDAGISPRWGVQPICKVADAATLYQGGLLYDERFGTPYLLLALNGNLVKVDPDSGTVTNLSDLFPGMTLPPLVDQAHFVQAEEFAVVQAGDNVTLPLIWDNNILRRSLGITNTAVAPGTPGVNEIPAASSMDYYMGRLWYGTDRQYSAGDIVGGGSGTAPYNNRDAVLNVTENPLVVGGDGFTVPDQSGNIRAIRHSANLNVQLGQGGLFIFTRKAVYQLNVPVTRTDWIGADTNNQPTQTVAQLVNGATGDRAIVAVNGDLYFQSFEPGIRSLVSAVRYFQQPGNIEISANENRILQFNDRELLRFGSGIEFDNRLLMTALPFRTSSGVAHRALVPLDFVPVSSFNSEYNPVWEGHWEGLDYLQVFAGDFGGRQRAFTVVVMRDSQELWLWELTRGDRFENGDKRVTWQIEFPAFTWGSTTNMKKLLGGELWIDRLFGTVEFFLDYRVDGETCWVPWVKWKECSARDSDEYNAPVLVPYPQPCGSGYRQTMDFPAPPSQCSQMRRPSNIGYQFQPRLTLNGYCRVRGIFLHATKRMKELYKRLPCNVA